MKTPSKANQTIKKVLLITLPVALIGAIVLGDNGHPDMGYKCAIIVVACLVFAALLFFAEACINNKK